MTNILVVLVLCCAPLVAFADDDGGAPAAAPAVKPPSPPAVLDPRGDGDEGFEKVDGSMLKGESIPADRLVGAAYGFILLAFVTYAVSVALRGRRVEEELDALRKKLEGK